MQENECIDHVPPTESDYSNHIKPCKRSGLSCKAYCRKHKLNYAAFLYHYRKFYPAPKKEQLIPVRIETQSMPSVINMLCKIELSTGHCLCIYDQRVLSDILSRIL